MVVIFGITCRLAGLSLFKVLRLIKDEIVLVFGTASGEVAFRRLVMKLEQAIRLPDPDIRLSASYTF